MSAWLQKYGHWLLVAVLLVQFAVHAVDRINFNDLPKGDQAAYLGLSIYIAEHGGVLGFIPNCLDGTYTEANRHPLFVLMLSTFAGRYPGFFANAKMFTLMLGLGLVMVSYLVARRLFGRTVAIWSLVLVGMNVFVVEYAAIVGAEPLLTLFFLLAFYFVVMGFERDERYWRWAGVCIGLAYLSKANGLFLFAPFAITGLIIQGFRFLRNREFYVAIGLCVLVASPLLLRNVIHYQSPLYNINSNIMWVDEFEQIYDPEIRATAGPLKYLATHSPGQIAGRMVEGAGRELEVIRKSFMLKYLYNVPFVRSFGGLVLFLLSIVFAFRERRKARRILVLTTVALFFLFFSWYTPIASSPRFILPVVPIMMFYLAFGFTRSWVWLKDVGTPKLALSSGPAYATLAVLLLTLTVVSSRGLANPWNSFTPAPGSAELRAWLQENVKEGERYLKGPADRYKFEWFSDIRGDKLPFPYYLEFDQLEEYIEREKIRYAVITHDELMKRPGMLGEHFSDTEDVGIALHTPVPGWRAVAADSALPRDFMVFAVGDSVLHPSARLDGASGQIDKMRDQRRATGP